MAGFNSVFGTAATPTATAPINSFAGVFGNGTQSASPTEADTRQALGQQAADARIESQKANSPLGLAFNTAKAFSSTVFNAGKDFLTGTADTYGSVVPQAVSQVESGAADIQNGDIAKGATKAALGTAGGFAGAVYAPIGAAIGAVLKATGGQALFDAAGQKIADTTGITDIPAFQKFAASHPNAGTYFGQTMNLVLGGADDGKILDSSKKTAQAIVDSAAKPAVADTASHPTVETPVVTDKSVEPVSKPSPQALGTEEPVQQPNTASEPVSTPSTSLPATDATPNGEATPTAETPTKGATDISANLVKEGEAELTPEQMASYKSGSYKDSAATAEALKAQDPEALKQMAITGQGIPEGVFPKILYNLVEKDAIDSKDYALQRELAKSPLNTEASTHAGQLGAGGFNKASDSPVDVLRKVMNDRAGSAVAKEAKKAKSTITKAAAKMMDYQSIIDAIKTC